MPKHAHPPHVEMCFKLKLLSSNKFLKCFPSLILSLFGAQLSSGGLLSSVPIIVPIMQLVLFRFTSCLTMLNDSCSGHKIFPLQMRPISKPGKLIASHAIVSVSVNMLAWPSGQVAKWLSQLAK